MVYQLYIAPMSYLSVSSLEFRTLISHNFKFIHYQFSINLYQELMSRRRSIKLTQVAITANSQAIITNQFPYKKPTISLFETIYKCDYVIWIVMALSCMLRHRLRWLMSSCLYNTPSSKELCLIGIIQMTLSL